MAAAAPEPAAVTDADEALDPPMPESSAPPPLVGRAPSTPPPGGIPSRSARFRRGSRGPRVGPPPGVQKIGVVEVDPNFKPRIELLPPTRPAEPVGTESAPATPVPYEEDRRRSEERRVGKECRR